MYYILHSLNCGVLSHAVDLTRVYRLSVLVSGSPEKVTFQLFK